MAIEKFTTPGASQYLGVAEKTLERWRSEGRGPKFVKLGSKVLYLKPELDAFIEAGERVSTADVGEGS